MVRKISKVKVEYDYKVTKYAYTFCLSVLQHPVVATISISETTFNRKAGRMPLKMRVMTAEGKTTYF